MPRAAARLKHREGAHYSTMVVTKFITLVLDFTDVGNGKWLCNICKADVMTVKQAIAHEVSVQHSTKPEVRNLQFASSAGNDPALSTLSSRRVAEQEHDYWADLPPRIVSFWRKG